MDINLSFNGKYCFLTDVELKQNKIVLDIQSFDNGAQYITSLSDLKTDDIYWLIKGLMEIPIIITLMNESSFKKMNEIYVNLFDTFINRPNK